MVTQSKIKAFIGKLKFISSPCLYRLIDGKDFDVICVTDDTCIIDKSEDIIGEWLYKLTRDMVLGSTWGGKNGCNSLVVSKSKRGINKFIFKRHNYYNGILNIEVVAAYTMEEKNIKLFGWSSPRVR